MIGVLQTALREHQERHANLVTLSPLGPVPPSRTLVFPDRDAALRFPSKLPNAGIGRFAAWCQDFTIAVAA